MCINFSIPLFVYIKLGIMFLFLFYIMPTLSGLVVLNVTVDVYFVGIHLIKNYLLWNSSVHYLLICN